MSGPGQVRARLAGIDGQVMDCRRQGAGGWLIGETRANRGRRGAWTGAVVVFAGQPWEFALPDPLMRGSDGVEDGRQY